jgi:hypothetical protein
MDDDFSELSAEDRAKLALLEKEWEREGDAAILRFFEKESVTSFRLMALLNPKAARRSLENALIDAGLTNADLRAMLEKALRERGH